MNDEQQYRVLLIEDCTRGMSPTFSQFAYSGNARIRMNLAANLFDAAHRLENNTYSLILLSLRLPDCQGTETLKRLRKMTPGTPVAVLLQNDEWHLEEETKALGARGAFAPGQVNVEAALAICQSGENLPLPPEPAEIENIVEPATPSIVDSVAVTEDVPATVIPEDQPLAEPDNSLIIPSDAPETAADNLIINTLQDAENLEVEITPVESTPVESTDESPESAAVENPQIPDEKAEVSPDVPTADTPEDSVHSPTAAPSATYDITGNDATGESANSGEELPEIANTASAEEPAAEVTATPVADNSPLADGDTATELTTAKEEILRLRKELTHFRAVNHELEGVSRALEERCRELEAGQAALIEAEHVAIEREKAARLTAEARLASVTEQFNALQEVENKRQELDAALQDVREDDTRLKELENANAALRSELDSLREQLHEQRDAAEQNGQTVNYLRTKVADYKQRAETAEGELVKLTNRFKKLQKSYHKVCGEKKNYEKRIASMERETQDILQKSGQLSAMYEKSQCDRLREMLGDLPPKA